MKKKEETIKLFVIAFLLFASIPTSFASVASFQALGDLPGGDFSSIARGVSADGSVVVGQSSSLSSGPNNMEGFRWSLTGGMQGLGDLSGGSFKSGAYAVSADGSVLVGRSDSDSGWEVVRWENGIITSLDFGGNANGVSADGVVVAGYTEMPSLGSEAFRWTEAGGIQVLGMLDGYSNSSALAISSDGLVVVGESSGVGRMEAFRWTLTGGMQGLGDLSGGGECSSIARGVSTDGSIVVGQGRSELGTEAFRWTLTGGMQGLGDLPGGDFYSNAYAISSDGLVVVGESRSGSYKNEAFIWEATNGMQNLKDLLVNGYGLDLTGWTLAAATGISADGLTITGYGWNPTGDLEAWIAKLPEPMVYYVDSDAEGANDGSNWANAYNYLQNALDAATYGDEIRVAQGIYRPSEFTLPLPGQASNPNPADGATDVNKPITLSWTAGDGADSYKIYFGTISPPPFVYHHSDTIFYPGILDDYTTYYWRIDSINVWGETTGTTWSFTTGEMPTPPPPPPPPPVPLGSAPPPPPPPPQLDRATTFQLKNGVVIKGGFAGFGEPDPNARDIDKYKTILSGDLLGNDVGDFTDFSKWENSYHVVTGSGCDETAVLDGFTITAGNDHRTGDYYPIGHGGGMLNESGSPTVSNCTFTDNYASDTGGGMFNGEGSPTLTNCMFIGNLAGGWAGGGMFNWTSSPVVTNCTFVSNSSKEWGGAICNYKASSPTLSKCIFSSNSSLWGGGMFNSLACFPTLTNCIFTGNSAVGENGVGGGMCNYDISHPNLTNCTFVGNKADRYGGAVVNYKYANTTLTNCILWDGGDEIYNSQGSVTVITYSDVQGGWPGEGNIDADPCFVSPEYFGPIAYWKFDEAGGTTAYDSIGQNHGILINGPTWTTGQINEALSFDGLNDYVCVPDDYSLDLGTHDLSFAFWFKTNESSIEQMLTKRSTTTGPSNRVWDGYSAALLADGTVNVHFRHSASSDSDVVVTSTASYNDGNWHHLAGVYTRSANLELYVDGVPEGTPGDISYAENKNIDLTQPLAIGCRVVYGRSNDLYFNGTIDDVKIFDRALYAEEIQQDYLNGLNGQAYPDANKPDYHLLPGSPCINAGDPDYVPEPNETDLDGKPRVIGGRIDMGAYEFNHTPVADAGQDRIVEAQGHWGATVTLDGSGSSDADSTPGTNDDITDFNWYKLDPCDPNADVLLGSGQILDCTLSIGEHIIVLEVIDRIGAFDTKEVTITVQDTTPPEFELSVSPTMLWPPDHKMYEITPSWTVNDDCDSTPEVMLVSIAMSENDDIPGGGNTSDDIQIGEDGSIYLRSERSGISSERIYTIIYQAVDDSGNTTVRSATVSIPHDFKVLARIAARWLWAGPGRIPEDLNGDGIVNLADFARFAENWIK